MPNFTSKNMPLLFGKNPNEKKDKHSKFPIERETGVEEEKRKEKEDKIGFIDESKKQSIWSLFSNVASTDSKGVAKNSLVHEVKSACKKNDGRKEMPGKENNLGNVLSPRNKGTELFKSAQINKALMEEVSSIHESNKRKNKILLSGDKSGGETDNILNSIKSVKKLKVNEEGGAIQCSAYNEFFSKNNTCCYKVTEEEKQLLDNTLIKDASSRLREEYYLSKKNKDNENEKSQDTEKGRVTEKEIQSKNRKIPIPPVIKKIENSGTKTVLKKKNICVPVHELNEKQILQSKAIKKMYGFHKNDKFNIFSRLGDDVLRYILMHLKNRDKLLVLDKRFSEMIQHLRRKLIYLESLKNTITPESIIKTIYASPNLEVLDLSGCSHLSSHHFGILSNSNNIKFNKSLKVLCLKNCNKMSNSSLKIFIQRFRNLKVLDIRNCYKISYEGIYPLRCKTSIEKLYLGNTTSANVTNNHNNDTLKVLFGNYDESVIQLDCVLSKLVCFEITYTKNLTDLSNLFYASKSLKILNIKGCAINDSTALFFKTLENLLALNVAETSISNEVLNVVMSTCKKLKVLDISKTPDILHRTLVEIPKNLKELRKIKIAHLPQVDNFCVREIFKNAKHLLSIDVSNCWKINNAFCDVNGLEVATGNNLRDIGAFQCSINKSVCEGHLSAVGCTNVRVHIYNELKLFETSIYNDIEILEAY